VNTIPKPRRIVFFRTDHIGDLVLTIPAVARLAAALPGARIAAVVSEGNREVALGQPWLDEVVVYRPEQGIAALVRQLLDGRYDAAILFYPRFKLALAARLAGIPVRVGTAYRWYSRLFTHRIRVHRRRNRWHEADLNAEMLSAFGLGGGPDGEGPAAPAIPDSARLEIETTWREQGIPSRYSVVHTGGMGSALNAGTEYYGAIVREMEEGFAPVVLTGTPVEGDRLAVVAAAGGLAPSRIVMPRGLRELEAVLAGAAGVVGPSTGPLHLAAALGVPTVSLFSPIDSQQPRRWRPLGGRATVLTPHPSLCATCVGAKCPLFNCVERTPPGAVIARLRELAG
jgi:heptosyltransferase-3